MTFKEALSKSLRYQKSIPKHIELKYIIPRVGYDELCGSKPQAFWKGHEHFTNICEADLFDQHKDDIEAGTLIVGPALYTVGDTYHFLPDCVGLYSI